MCIPMRASLAAHVPSLCISLSLIFFFYILRLLIRYHWIHISSLFIFRIMIGYSRIYLLFICMVFELNRLFALLFFWLIFFFFYFYFFIEKITYTFLPIIRH